MRTWSFAAVCLVLGGVLGWGIAELRIRDCPWDGTGAGTVDTKLAEAVGQAPPITAESMGVPSVAVEGENHDFGVMQQKGTGKHAFTIKNTGTGPLKLTKGSTTCKCTLADLDTAQVNPGESTKVTLEWHGKLFDGAYRQSATILTNDPSRPEVSLTVTGRIVALVKAVPTDVVFSTLSPSRSSTAEVKFFGFGDTPLTLTNQQWLDPRSAAQFEYRIEPMPADVLQSEKSAKSGLIIRLTVKPGLPIGPFHQTLRTHTNVSDVQEVEIPIHGTVVGAVTIAGRDWDHDKGVLMLGQVLQSAGEDRVLKLLCRGPDRDKFQFKVAEVWPSFFDVKLEDEEKGGGVLRQIPLRIRIPKGTPAANHFGGSDANPLGRILLDTGIPGAPPVQIKIHFAIVSE